jgi:hypothetical protein
VPDLLVADPERAQRPIELTCRRPGITLEEMTRLIRPPAVAIAASAIWSGCSATVPAAPPAGPPPPGPVTTWAEPVNGITVRIEQAVPELGTSLEPDYFVGIKNISNRAIRVPLPTDGGQPQFVIGIDISGHWENVFGDQWTRHAAKAASPGCLLAPGDDVLCQIEPESYARLRLAEAEKITVTAPPTADPIAWSGRIETPSQPAFVPPGSIEPMLHTLPLAKHLPAILTVSTLSPNGFGNDPAFVGYLNSNTNLFTQLVLYSDHEVASELDRDETLAADPNLKLALAVEMMNDDRITASNGETGPVSGVAAELAPWLGDSKSPYGTSILLKQYAADPQRPWVRTALANSNDPCAMPALLDLAHRELDGKAPDSDDFPISAVWPLGRLNAVKQCRCSQRTLAGPISLKPSARSAIPQ